MYAQPHSNDCDDMQSFTSAGYNIPANYQGNAFTVGEPPTDAHTNLCEECECSAPEMPAIQSAPPRCPSEAHCQETCKEIPKKQDRGLLSGIFERFSRGLELDDILLIGLIILLLQNDCDNRDETVILLALLLLGGF